MIWRIHHCAETISTNLDARAGVSGDVYTADFQTAGRGRLDHRWLSAPGKNLTMSAVVSVASLPPETVATLPLVAGFAVVRAARRLFAGSAVPLLKWPNDVLVGGRKLAGILCERAGDVVIVGVGVNVGEMAFPPELADRAVSLALLLRPATPPSVLTVRDVVLEELSEQYERWRMEGFAALYPEIAAVDFLRDRSVAVLQIDGDASPSAGVCGGICADGSLDVGGRRLYAGEARVLTRCAPSVPNMV